LDRAVIRLTSVTYSIRAQKLLGQNGIWSYIKRLSKNINAHGCGYGLEVERQDVQRAYGILSSSGIRVVEIV